MKRVKESFVADRDGAPVMVQRGRTIDDNHPLIAKYPDMFEDVTADIRWDATASTEVATANPGEVRHVAPAPVEEAPVEEKTEEAPVVEEEKSNLPDHPIDGAKYSYAEVKALMIDAGLPATGTKDQIVARYNARFGE